MPQYARVRLTIWCALVFSGLLSRIWRASPCRASLILMLHRGPYQTTGQDEPFEGTELPSEVAHLVALNAQLKTVGRLPRIFSCVLVAVSIPVSLSGWFASRSLLLALCTTGVPLMLFALSWRVRARATRKSLIVRSYLRTYTMRFDDVMGFIDSGYAGVWNRYTGGETRLNIGLRMIDVSPLRGTTISLPATMMRRRSSKVIVEMLNDHVPSDLPPGDRSSV